MRLFSNNYDVSEIKIEYVSVKLKYVFEYLIYNAFLKSWYIK